MQATLPDSAAKQAVWRAYFDRRPTRVPVRFSTNPRIILLDPQLNEHGDTFESAANDPEVHVRVELLWQRYLHTTLNRYCDGPVGLPDKWQISLHAYNVYEAALLGGPVQYVAGQVPSNEPWLNDDNKHDVFDIAIDDPINAPFIADRLAFWHEMQRVCDGMTFEGRAVELQPWALVGTDGPVTAACSLRGDAFLIDLIADPDYADRLLGYVTRSAIARREAFWKYWGDRIARGSWMADDSCVLLSNDMYRERVLPHHRAFLDAAPGPRSMHMCGDAGRLFPIIHRELGVTGFDTGFPLDHGRMRRELGPDAEISGGPQIALLLSGTPDEVYIRTRDILQSGIMEGGRFILQEGNNLPPCCPLENLEAMYQAGLEFGTYPQPVG